FKDGGRIPDRCTCKGENMVPNITWRDAPGNTRSFAFILDDPDAPSGLFTHWLVFNIPADEMKLSGVALGQSKLGGGALQGRNSAGETNYFGPCPPPGKAHRYRFTLYALNGKLNLAAGASRSALDSAIKTHILAEAR